MSKSIRIGLEWSVIAIFSLCFSISFADRGIFNSKLKDPEHPSILDAVRRVSRSVAGLGNGKGHFIFQISEQFLKRNVDVYNESGIFQKSIKMEKALFYIDINEIYEEKKSGEKLWKTIHKNDYVLKYLKRFNVINGPISWKNKIIYDELSKEKQGSIAGTGFYIGGNYVLTNHHCISTQEKCNVSAFHFNHELDFTLKKVKKIDVYNCKKVLLSDPQLDFSLVELDGNPEKKISAS